MNRGCINERKDNNNRGFIKINDGYVGLVPLGFTFDDIQFVFKIFRYY